MQFLKQSTASQVITLGQFLDSTDGNTEEDGLTIANTDIKIRKNAATTLASKNSGGATNISDGVYHTTLDATDTDTAGRLEIYTHLAGALVTKNVFMVLTATAYDALHSGTFNNLGGVAQTVDNNVLAAGSTGFAAIDTVVDTILSRVIGTIESGSHNPASTAQLGALTDWIDGGRLDLLLDAIPTTAMRGTDGANTTTPDNASIAAILVDTANMQPKLGTPAADISADIAAVKSVVDAIPTTAMRGTDSAATEAKQDIIDTNVDTLITQVGTAGAGLTDLGGMSTAMKAEVLAEVVKLLTTQMTESYAADGVAPTLAQSLFLVGQFLYDHASAGTTKTVKKIDGSTTAATFTYDSGTVPTALVRAT